MAISSAQPLKMGRHLPAANMMFQPGVNAQLRVLQHLAILGRGILGGFNRSSQQLDKELLENFSRRLPAKRFAWFRIQGMGYCIQVLAVCRLRSVPLGKYCRSKPLMFSLDPASTPR